MQMEVATVCYQPPTHPTLGFWSRHFGGWPLVVEFDSFGCWTLGCWRLWLLNPGFWLLNPGFWLLNPALLVVEALVVESFGCWNRLFWLLKPWLLNPAVLVVESGFFGCWIRLCWLLKHWLLNVLVVDTGFFGCWSYGCWIRRYGCWIRRFGCWTLVVESGLVVEPGFVLCMYIYIWIYICSYIVTYASQWQKKNRNIPPSKPKHDFDRRTSRGFSLRVATVNCWLGPGGLDSWSVA